MNPPITAAQLGSPKSGSRQDDSNILTLSFDDNRLLSLLCGEHDENLAIIEHRLNVDITPRGNRLAVRGTDSGRDSARDVLMSLYNRARRGLDVTKGEVEGAIRMREAADTNIPSGAIRTRRKLVMARTPTQGTYIEAIRKHELVFGVGPAGTGKTYLAVACAAEALMNGEVDRIDSRPRRHRRTLILIPLRLGRGRTELQGLGRGGRLRRRFLRDPRRVSAGRGTCPDSRRRRQPSRGRRRSNLIACGRLDHAEPAERRGGATEARHALAGGGRCGRDTPELRRISSWEFSFCWLSSWAAGPRR